MNQPPDALSRRHFLQAFGVGGAVLALAACTRSEGVHVEHLVGSRTGIVAAPPGPGSLAKARYGGKVVTGWSSEPNSYDAALGYDLQSWEAINCLLYTPLYQYQHQFGGPAPSAASALPTVSADGREYTIPLRPGVLFHNGRPVVAQDYVYSWTRVLDAKLESWASSYLLSIEGATAYNAGKAKSVTGLTAVDEHTLRVQLSAPDITFPTLMCLPFMAAVPAEEVERLGDKFSHTPVGTGPFKIASYDTQSQSARFVRNDAYFWKRTPFLDEVVYRWGIDPSLQFLQLQNGNLDVLGEGLTVSSAARVQAKASLRKNYLIKVPVNGISFVAPNYKNSALKDVRVRQALNWATDRDQLAKFTHGTADAWGAAFPKNEPNYNRIATPYTLDLPKARSLMRAAGLTKLHLEFINGGDDVWPLLSQVLQQQWAEIGVTLTLTTMSSSAFDEAVTKQQGDLFGTHWYQVQPSALDIVNSNFVTGASSNYNGYSNKHADALAAKALASRTTTTSNAILAQLEKVLTDDAAEIFVGSLNFLAARAPRVQNYFLRGETGSYYDRMWV